MEHLRAHRIPGPDACGEILLVGEDNPLSADPRYALYHEPIGCAGHRLQSRILGIRPRQWYLPLWRTNLCAGAWSASEASDRAGALLDPRSSSPWRVVVMLGRRVETAFRRHVGDPSAQAPFSVRPTCPGFQMVSLPHPSGRCLAWNDPSAAERARLVLRSAAPGVPWGESAIELGGER